MAELDTVFVIETLDDLYVVEDEVFEGKVLDGALELATRFHTIEDANDFLREMDNAGIQGTIQEARIFIELVQ